MTKEEMIEKLRYKANNIKAHIEPEFFNEVADVLEKQTWTSVSDGVPQEKGCYLTTSMYKEVHCDHWNGEYFDRTELVIAWMPLPEPYKKDGGETDENKEDN